MQKQIIDRSYHLGDCSFPSDISPLMARIYSARGICSEQQLNKKLKNLPDYHQLKDIDKAATLLANAITQQQKIVIIGDFDCDGATSSALGMLAIKAMGGHVSYLVPNRFEYGYGLTPDIVEAATAFQPDMLVTVDNGISSIEGVAAAKEKGLNVIVTDHHLAGETLPAADAIVNPNQPGCPFSAKNTAGVGIIFYVMCALRTELRQMGWFAQRPEPNLAEYLDLVALGTVADVVSLDAPNRILVFQGLARIRSGHCRQGIKALIEIARREPRRLSASDLGFALAPRLNAAGRLDDMSAGIELLLTNNPQQARQLAAELDNLNQERKAIESSMQEEAKTELEQLQLNKDSQQVPWGISLFKDSWHQGVVGILAARIKEQFHRPVIAFAQASDEEIKGSARSIAGLHMRDTLDSLARKHPGLVSNFGGHAMAAGLTIKKAHFTRFKVAFNQEVQDTLSPEDLNAVIYTDGELTPADMTLATATELREGGPWGQHFSEPLFRGRFRIIQQRLVGKKHLKMMLTPVMADLYLDAIAFNIDPTRWPDSTIKTIDVVYKLDINEYKGQQHLQLMVDYFYPID